MGHKYFIGVCLSVCIFATGCSLPFSSDTQTTADKNRQISPEKIVISEVDILDRPYKIIGDVSANDAPSMPFSKANKLEATKNLRLEASKMGADGIIFVNYVLRKGTWESPDNIEAKGKAIKFTHY